MKRTPFYAQLYVQVLTAIVAGGLIGHFAPETGVALKPLGDGFIRLVKMIIAPVIFLTIVTGIAGMRNLGSVGRVAGKAFAYFLFFSTIALIVGLIVANVVQPGAGMNIDPATLETGAVDDYVKKAKDQTIVSFLLGIIPETVAGAFVDGNLLQVLFLAISFGIALSTAGEAARPVVRLFEALGRLGTTVVVATHDVNLLSKVPDSLFMRLDNGRLSDPTGALRYPPRRETPPVRA